MQHAATRIMPGWQRFPEAEERRMKRGRARRRYMLELSTRRWLSKVLLIKIKFIACLLIKMKTDAGRERQRAAAGAGAGAKKLLLAARGRCCS